MQTSKRLFIPVGLKEDIHDKVFLHHKKSEQLYYKYLYIIHLLYTHSTLNKETYNKNGVALYSDLLAKSIGRRDKSKIFSNLQNSNGGLLSKFVLPLLKYKISPPSSLMIFDCVTIRESLNEMPV